MIQTSLQRLAELQKRGGARAFGPRLNSETPFYSEGKRYNAPSYYFYRQPKRGGGRAFAAYYKPSKFSDPRFISSPLVHVLQAAPDSSNFLRSKSFFKATLLTIRFTNIISTIAS
uniref:Uncharacterized protein n=1 Tax=Syphacia muris TaxID=451379 RepID=A0A0N5AZS6_9BILA